MLRAFKGLVEVGLYFLLLVYCCFLFESYQFGVIACLCSTLVPGVVVINFDIVWLLNSQVNSLVARHFVAIFVHSVTFLFGNISFDWLLFGFGDESFASHLLFFLLLQEDAQHLVEVKLELVRVALFLFL